MKKILLAFSLLLGIFYTSSSQPISRYALVVGVGEYPKAGKWPRLHSDEDARQMKNLLLKKGLLEGNIEMLVNEQATYHAIRIAFKKIYRSAEPEDQVFIYLGGHSQQITDKSGDETDVLDEAFVPYDAAPKYTPGLYEGSSHLLDDEIGTWITLLSEKVTRMGSVVVLYDGGLSMPGKPGVGQKGTFPPFKIPGITKNPFSDNPHPSDNEWFDFSYTEENNQVVTLDPGEPLGCHNSETRKADGKYGSYLVSCLIAATEKGQANRFRDLTRTYRRAAPQCNLHLDGAVQQEIFPKQLERQFISPASDEKTQGPEGNIFSVVIGVSNYQNVDPLQYGDADAMLFHSVLVSQKSQWVKPENQYLFLDSNATIKPIIDALEEITRLVEAGDRVYFYFAGHGDVENLLSRKAHLLLYNSPANVYKAGGTLPVEDVKDYFQQWIYRKARVFLVVDACKSGKLAGGLAGSSAALANLKEVASNSARLLSCQPNELSKESELFGGGHGVFTYYMAKGITGQANRNGDQHISIHEIGTFLSDSVSLVTDRRQTPMIEGNQKLTFLPLIQVLPVPDSVIARQQKVDFRFTESAVNDSLKARWIRELRNHLAANAIVEPEGKCAKATYERLANMFYLDNKLLKGVAKEIKLLIDKRSQSLINAYIQGNEVLATESAFLLATKELHFLLDITEMSDPLYFMYLSRSYFFEGRSIQPLFVDNDLNRHKLNNAIRNLKRSLSYEPEGAQNHNAIGRLQQVNRQYPEAIASYKKAIVLAPAWKFPINNLASAFDEHAIASGNHLLTDSAVYYYRKALIIDSGFVVAHKNLGKAYLNQGKNGLAKSQYRKAIQLNTGYAEAYQNLGDVYRLEQKWDSAVYYLNLGLETSPDNPNLLCNLGNVYFDQITDNPELKENLMKEAAKWYRQALRQSQVCMEASLGLGHIFWEKNQYDSAARYYKRVVALDSNTVLYQNYHIEALMRNGKLPEAEKESMKLVKKQPKDAMNWFDLGVIAVLNRNMKLAISRFQKSINLGLTDIAVYRNEPLLLPFLTAKELNPILKQLK